MCRDVIEEREMGHARTRYGFSSNQQVSRCKMQVSGRKLGPKVEGVGALHFQDGSCSSATERFEVPML